MKKQLLNRSLWLPLVAVLIAVSGSFANRLDSRALTSGWAKVEGDCQVAEADEECDDLQLGTECTTTEGAFIYSTEPACSNETPSQILRRPQ
jgi:hypothetical protein